MQITTDKICSQCQSQISRDKDSISTGYGIDSRTQAIVCFSCCAKNDTIEMLKSGKFIGYYTKKAGFRNGCVTNWPGSLTVPCTTSKESRHNFGCKRTDFWFKDSDFSNWHGYQIGNNNEIAYCKRLKDDSFVYVNRLRQYIRDFFTYEISQGLQFFVDLDTDTKNGKQNLELCVRIPAYAGLGRSKQTIGFFITLPEMTQKKMFQFLQETVTFDKQQFVIRFKDILNKIAMQGNIHWILSKHFKLTTVYYCKIGFHGRYYESIQYGNKFFKEMFHGTYCIPAKSFDIPFGSDFDTCIMWDLKKSIHENYQGILAFLDFDNYEY